MTEYIKRTTPASTTKLTDAQCLEVIERVRAGGVTQRALALEYKVSPGTICLIVNGKRKSLLPPEPLPESKVCTQCGEDKALDDYYTDVRSRVGRQSECKVCANDRTGENARNTPSEVRLLRGAKYRAKEGGYPFDITLDDIVIPACCPILGIELVRGDGQPTANSPTLDKIDPSLGYVPGNVQVISFKANSMKRDASALELHRFAQWVLDNVGGE